jgi:hypothetical protein
MYNLLANPAQLVIMASEIKEVSQESLSVINYTHCFAKQIYAEEIFMLAISVKKSLSNQGGEVDNPRSVEFVDCVHNDCAGERFAVRFRSSASNFTFISQYFRGNERQ